MDSRKGRKLRPTHRGGVETKFDRRAAAKLAERDERIRAEAARLLLLGPVEARRRIRDAAARRTGIGETHTNLTVAAGVELVLLGAL